MRTAIEMPDAEEFHDRFCEKAKEFLEGLVKKNIKLLGPEHVVELVLEITADAFRLGAKRPDRAMEILAGLGGFVENLKKLITNRFETEERRRNLYFSDGASEGLL